MTFPMSSWLGESHLGPSSPGSTPRYPYLLSFRVVPRKISEQDHGASWAVADTTNNLQEQIGQTHRTLVERGGRGDAQGLCLFPPNFLESYKKHYLQPNARGAQRPGRSHLEKRWGKGSERGRTQTLRPFPPSLASSKHHLPALYKGM